MTNMEPNKGEIVMYQPDETIRLEVRMDGETGLTKLKWQNCLNHPEQML